MTITLDIIQTLGLAVCVYIVGRWIKSKVTLFQKYFIPAPVIGGLLCSILIFAGKATGLFTIEMTNTLQDFFMNIFFTGTGLHMQPCDPQKERKARREAGSRRSYFPGRSESCRCRSCRSLRTEPAARDRDGIHCNVRRRGIRSFLWPYIGGARR